MNIPKKHQGNDLTIFSEMSSLAKTYNAINLSQGFPDYEIDTRIKELLAEATNLNYNQYAPMTGFPPLIDQIILFNKNRLKPININTDEVTVIPGATYGIYCILAAILQMGDEVIVQEPAYDSYAPAIQVNGGSPVFVSLTESFRPDFEAIKSSISPKTKAIIVNTPHNPTGMIWTEQDWENLWQIIKDTEIMVISDEVYDLLCYDNHQFVSAQHHSELRKRSYSIFSFGKMFHLTGWKVGYVLAGDELTKAFRRVHQYLCFSVNSPAQYALSKYLELFDQEENTKMLQLKRDYFLKSFQDLPFSFTQISMGSYFQVATFDNPDQLSDKEYAIWLTKEKGVCVIPISAFYHDERHTGQVRFCFAKLQSTINQAAEKLRSY